jgi:hypothetical protein
MECKGIREKLSAYLEGDLPSEEKRLIEAHLNSCQQCSSAVEDLGKTGEFLKNLEEVEPPAWMTKKIMARVRAEQEKKRGIFQKLFYPLHIKVPIEALATVLIAVLAVYVFRALEPEMKSIPVPPAVGPITTREEAPKPSREPAADTLAPRAKEAIKEQRRSDKDTAAPAPPAGALQARQEGKYLLSRPAEEPLVAKKKEVVSESQGELGRAAEALKKQEPPERKAASPSPLQERENLALSDTARDTRERKKMAAAPKAMGTAAIKPEPVQILVTVKDVRGASGEVETFLGQAGARNIKKESLEGREVLTAELKAESVREFLDKLKVVGEMKEEPVSPDIAEGNIPIRVEIISNP